MLAATKHWWESKLFWVGFLQILLGVVDLIETNVLQSERAAWGAVLTGTITIILRYLTTQPLTFSGQAAKPVDPAPAGGPLQPPEPWPTKGPPTP
jgi:hypothetical protein